MPRTISFARTSTASVAALLLIGACSGTTSSKPSDSPSITHVHGLGVNPADKSLYVATHHGVFRVGKDIEQIGPKQDTMGFTVAGPDSFLASGHSEPPVGPANLGLIASTNGARTWAPIAFADEADFHAIDTSKAWTYAYGADQGLVRSTADRPWTNVTNQPLYDIAADPNDPDHLLVTTDQGQLEVLKVGRKASAVPTAPVMGPIDYADTNVVVGLGPSGQVYVTENDGIAWAERADLPGESQAIDATPGLWHAATSTGIYKSVDDGSTWALVYRAP